MISSQSKKKTKPSIEEITQCPQCSSTHLTKDYSRAELVCEDATGPTLGRPPWQLRPPFLLLFLAMYAWMFTL